MSPERKAQASELVTLEAQYLDEKSWDAWLELYREDAVFWAPTWVDEATPASDPATQLSFIYLEGRIYLQERVVRVKSGRSVAAMPAPRTVHLVTPSSVRALEGDASCRVSSAWISQVYDHKTATSVHYAGRYEHDLAWDGQGWRIARKKILIANDQLQSKVDFFYI